MGRRFFFSVRINRSTEVFVGHLVVVCVRNFDGMTQPCCNDMGREALVDQLVFMPISMPVTTVFVLMAGEPSSSRWRNSMKKKLLPVTVVENGGRFEVRLDGRLIQIRTRSGTLMESVFSTRVAAEGYRAALVGLEKMQPADPLPVENRRNRGTSRTQESEKSNGRCKQEPAQGSQAACDQG